jgi:predicted O-methyltransferase YrrM
MKGNTFHHHYHILYSLRDLIHKEKVTYCEIGTFNGGSLCLMLQHPKDIKVVSIDPFHLARTNKKIVDENIKTFNIYNRTVELTEQFSNNLAFLKQLQTDNFNIDILFIDGDNSYKTVIEDFNNFKDFVNPGGFVVFDDYNDKQYSPEVFPAVNDIVKDIREKNLPFRIVGNPFNFYNIYPSDMKFLNEFIIQRK